MSFREDTVPNDQEIIDVSLLLSLPHRLEVMKRNCHDDNDDDKSSLTITRTVIHDDDDNADDGDGDNDDDDSYHDGNYY